MERDESDSRISSQTLVANGCRYASHPFLIFSFVGGVAQAFDFDTAFRKLFKGSDVPGVYDCSARDPKIPFMSDWRPSASRAL